MTTAAVRARVRQAAQKPAAAEAAEPAGAPSPDALAGAWKYNAEDSLNIATGKPELNPGQHIDETSRRRNPPSGTGDGYGGSSGGGGSYGGGGYGGGGYGGGGYGGGFGSGYGGYGPYPGQGLSNPAIGGVDRVRDTLRDLLEVAPGLPLSPSRRTR